MTPLHSDHSTMMRKFSFTSHDHTTTIHGYLWVPKIPVRAILQISHGMTEHIVRYDSFARYLNTKGVLVVGHDHLGHGDSVQSEDLRGYFAEKDGDKIVIHDLYQITRHIHEQYPGIPYFILGHSMGSFFARRFIAYYGNEIDGAIILGTGYKKPLTINSAIAITSLVGKFKKPQETSKLIETCGFGHFNKKIPMSKTPKDWLSKDTKIIEEYLNDPACMFEFTINGYETLFKSIRIACDPRLMEKMPKTLPVLIASGEDDPVGDYGEGVKTVYKMFSEVGMQDVSLRLYPNDRHELLNESDREQIFQDIWQWIYSHII